MLAELNLIGRIPVASMTIFTCVLRQVPRERALHPDSFQLVKEFACGQDELLWEGSFYECRSMMEDLYKGYIRDSSHFTVYWRDEFSLLVYQQSRQEPAVHMQLETNR